MSKWNRTAKEATLIERDRSLIGPLNGSFLAPNCKTFTIADGEVAWWPFWHQDASSAVDFDARTVPGRLGIRQLHPPFHLCSRNLTDYGRKPGRVHVVFEDSEASPLTFNPAGVLIGGHWRFGMVRSDVISRMATLFRPHKERVGLAHTTDSDCGVNLVNLRHDACPPSGVMGNIGKSNEIKLAKNLATSIKAKSLRQNTDEIPPPRFAREL